MADQTFTMLPPHMVVAGGCTILAMLAGVAIDVMAG